MMAASELDDAKARGGTNLTDAVDKMLLPVPQPPRAEAEAASLQIFPQVRGKNQADVHSVTVAGQIRVEGYNVQSFRYSEQRAFRKVSEDAEDWESAARQ